MRAVQLAVRVVSRSYAHRTHSTSHWKLSDRQLSSWSNLRTNDKPTNPLAKQQKEQSSPSSGSSDAEPAEEVCSKLMDSRSVYELQTHDVIPQLSDKYHSLYVEHVPKFLQKGYGIQLVGSWRVGIGDEDQFVHLWKYPGGYSQVSKFLDDVRDDKYMAEFSHKLQQCLRSRHTELYQKFTYWNDTEPRSARHSKRIYEMHTYRLKTGTMIEWENCWARGVRTHGTSSFEPVIGMCSQIGQLYTVQHIWAYDDLASGKKMHEETWQTPNWHYIVQNITPLIHQMDSKIMLPMSYSPLL